MPIWKITATMNRNNGKQSMEKGMFIELSTPSTTPPLGHTQYDKQIKNQFLAKYGLDLDVLKLRVCTAYFSCGKL